MAATDWDECVTRAGRCSSCPKEFAEQESYCATLVETPASFERKDYCQACWNDERRGQAFSFWQARIPAREEKPKLFVDNEILMQVFRRLVEDDDESKQGFTFVLMLILMRKRVLKYMTTEHQDDHEWWVVRVSGKDDRYRVRNPNMTESELEAMREQLNEVLAGG